MNRQPRNRRRLNIRHEYQPQLLVVTEVKLNDTQSLSLRFASPVPRLTSLGPPAIVTQFGWTAVAWEVDDSEPFAIIVVFNQPGLTAGGRAILAAWDPGLRTASGGYIAPFNIAIT